MNKLEKQTIEPGYVHFLGRVKYEKLAPLVREIGKSRTIVEYALHDSCKPIGVATYEITRTLPKELKDQLPRPEEIAALLERIEE